MMWLHQAVVAGFAFGIGASVGSFLNVCAWRLPRGMSVVRPPSRCPVCGSAIAARDNVPVLGWLLLRGRCRRCARPISPRYPLVEAACGVLFALAACAVTAADPFDTGLPAALGRLAYHWALIALLTTSALMAYDRLGGVRSLAAVRTGPPPAAGVAAAVVALATCLAGDPVGAVLNLGLLAVLLGGPPAA